MTRTPGDADSAVRPADGLGRDRQRFFGMLAAAREARRNGGTASVIEHATREADRKKFGAADLAESHWGLDEALAQAVALSLCEPLYSVGDRDPAPLELGSEVEIAKRVLNDAEPVDPQWVSASGGIWQYDHTRGVWVRVPEEDLHRRIIAYDGALVPAGSGKVRKLKPVKLSARGIVGVTQCVAMMRAQPDFFDTETDGTVFADAFVTLGAGGKISVAEHSPQHRARVAMPWRWPGHDAVPDGFVSALRGIWADRPDPDSLIQLLREWIGAMLAGVSTRYSRGLFLSGPGGTGKSTIVSVVVGLVPADAVCSVTLQKMGSDYHVAALNGKRLNAMPDLPYASIEDTGVVKAIMTGDPVGARSPYHEPFYFRPRCGHLASANKLPGVGDHTSGWLRRWLPVECSRVLSETTGEIKDLDKLLLKHEGGKIAAWALRGASDLVARGRYEIPADVEESLSEWRRHIDPVVEFVEDACTRIDPRSEVHRGQWTRALDLHKSYCEWASRNRYKELSTRALFERLGSIGIDKQKRADANYWAVCDASRKQWN